ncbi:MAG: hypothetical protein F7B11_05005 [Caldisphaeraceae archaeon]|nr:hypothetical protein [Caldisphaeraceae archaeon]
MYLQKNIKDVLLRERIIGYLDPGAEWFLFKINKNTHIFTTSSCMGRITIIEGRWYWERDRARIVMKSHSPITIYDIAKAITRPFDNLWLRSTGPILHLKTRKIECAFFILEVARSSGFKHSGIISRSKDEHTIELMSAVQISIPLKINGTFTFEPRSLNHIVKLANDSILEGRKRLEKLATNLEKINC